MSIFSPLLGASAEEEATASIIGGGAGTGGGGASTPLLYEGIKIFKEALPLLQNFFDAIYTDEQKEVLRRELINAMPELILAAVGLGVGLYLLWNDEENIGILFGKERKKRWRREGDEGSGGSGGEEGGEGGEGEEGNIVDEETRAIILLILYVLLVVVSAVVLTYKLYLILTKVNQVKA